MSPKGVAAIKDKGSNYTIFSFWGGAGFLDGGFSVSPGTHSVDLADLELRDPPASFEYWD